jgi:uncharacterized membrane-anchored protein
MRGILVLLVVSGFAVLAPGAVFANVLPPEQEDAPAPADQGPAPDKATGEPPAPAGPPETPASEGNPELQKLQQIADKLTYRDGVVDLPGGQASVNLGTELAFLDAADAKVLLVDIFRNPPEVASDVLGAIVPKGISPLHPDSWVAVITYSNEGHVDDADAAGLNYDDLLQQMQTAIRDANDERIKQGYEPLNLVGWAEQPHYDQPTHKLYWAKRLRFGTSQEDTLNYAIRALGRNGVLEINIVAGMSQLAMVNKKLDGILKAVDFKEGWKYSDFDPSLDSKAAYGIGGLIAGAAAAKFAGKGIIALIAAFWKFIVIGIGAAIAGLVSLVRRRDPKA